MQDSKRRANLGMAWIDHRKVYDVIHIRKSLSD